MAAKREGAVVFVTCRAFPEISEDDALAAKECQKLGLQVQASTWEDKGVPWASFEGVVLRSTWNYYRRSVDFAMWLDSIRGCNVWNPIESLLWNLDKGYLRDIGKMNLPVVPTKWVENGPSLSLKDLAAEFDCSSLILKPPVSADSHRTFLVSDKEMGDPSILSQFRVGDPIMVQPYLAEVQTYGELSFIFIGKEFSHCVRKTPKRGDFRVQEKFGGLAERLLRPPKEFLSLAQALLGTISSDLLYARVDMIGRSGNPLISELELLEPSLYFKHDNKAPARFAKALKKRLES